MKTTKMHGLPDKVIKANLIHQHNNLNQHAHILNNHGRVLLWTVALAVVEAVAVVYLALRG